MNAYGIHQLDPTLIEGFVENFLLDTYADAHPIADFHRELWQLCCLSHPNVVIAAPRAHSKSTSVNHGFGLSAGLFRALPFQLKISRTEGIAIEYIRSAKDVLLNNRRVQTQFGFRGLSLDREDDFVADFGDGYQMRMMAYGSEQAMRGAIWGTRRPDLVIGDDLEDQEQVLNAERRKKMLEWWMNTVMPIGGRNTMFRVVGTVLHIESLLMTLINSSAWFSRVYEACDDQFQNILWPEMWPEERLRAKHAEFVSVGNSIGWEMEYRNRAIDTSQGYFRPEDFKEMQDADHHKPHRFYVSGDLAISTAEKRDYTVFIVAGIDPEGFLDVVDVRRGRWDARRIAEEIFSIEMTYSPDEWYVEDGQIRKAMGYGLEIEMRERGVYPNFCNKNMTPVKDKMSRARSIQGRMRSGAVRFNKKAAWYPALETELTAFDRWTHDDQVDAMAWMGVGLARMITPLTASDNVIEMWRQRKRRAQQFANGGRSRVTGY